MSWTICKKPFLNIFDSFWEHSVNVTHVNYHLYTSKYTFGVAPKKSTFFNINWKLCSSRGGTFPSQPENLCYDPESTYRFHPLMFLFTVCMEGDMHTHQVDQLCTYSGQLTIPNILSNVLRSHITSSKIWRFWTLPLCNQFDPFLRGFFIMYKSPRHQLADPLPPPPLWWRNM